MLNLESIFKDAIVALDKYSEYLAVPPLPATVFMMQRDVINHYRYALTHYFDLSLDESYLQNSSLGSPYDKWAKFTNEDFAMLSFAIHNLIRYTSRLIHESECIGLRKTEQYSEKARRSNSYTYPICDISFYKKSIGIRVEEENVLVRTPFASTPYYDGRRFMMVPSTSEKTDRECKVIDLEGNWQTVLLTDAECRELRQVLREYRYDISDRTVIESIKDDGISEVGVLESHNLTFEKLCNQYYSDRQPAIVFDRMIESWCV